MATRQKVNINGRITVQQLVINSSNFSLFRVDLTTQTIAKSTRANDRASENKATTNSRIASMLEYSVRRTKEKYIDEYSVIKPATNSDSDSGKSKGTLFSSASAQTRANTNHA